MISPERIKELRTKAGLSDIPTVPNDVIAQRKQRLGIQDAPKEPGFVDKISGKIKERGGNINEILTDTTRNPAVAGFESAGEGAGAVMDVAVETAKPVLTKAVGNLDKALGGNPLYDLGKKAIKKGVELASNVVDKAEDSEEFANFGQSLNDLIAKHPEGYKLAEDTLKVLSSSGKIADVALGAEGAVQGLTRTGDALKTAAQDTAANVKSALEARKASKLEGSMDVIKEGGKVSPEVASEYAWIDVQPKATEGTKRAYAASRNVSDQGMFTGAKLTPTESDKPLIEATQKLYENGTLKKDMTYNQKMDAVEQRAAQIHQEQKSYLADHDKAVSLSSKDGSDIYSKISKASERNTLPFAKDSSAKGAYDSAIDVFKANLQTGKSAGTVKDATTLSKLDEALTKFDEEMDKFGAWEREATGELTEVDRARIQAIRDIHNEVRDYIDSQMPGDGLWKNIRSNEAVLYRVGDRMVPKLASTVGPGKLPQELNKYPRLKRGILWTLGTVGAGTLGAAALN